jgi:tyrosine-protein kinase Etk/Wzc
MSQLLLPLAERINIYMKALQEQPAIDVPQALGDADVESSGVEFLDFLIVLAKRKKFILLLTGGLGLVAAVVSFLLPNRYTATTSIMPPQQTQSTSAMLMSQFAGGSGLGSLASLAGRDFGLKSPNDLYIAMLKSRTVETAIISRFGFLHIYREEVISEARKRLEADTTIVSRKDGLIVISFDDRDRKRSAEVANAYVEELRNLTKHLALTEASQRRIFFEEQLQEAEQELANAEVAMKETQQKTGMIQLDSQSRAMIEVVGRIRAQIAAKEVQLQAMGSFATEQNPEYVLARQELAGLRQQLSKFEQGQPSDNGDPLIATGRIPAAGLEYVRRYRDVKYRETIFGLLAKQFEAAKLDEAKDAAVIQVIDIAVPPDEKSWPHRAIIVVAAVLCGLLAGSLWVLGGEMLDRARGDRHVAERLTQLRFHVRLKEDIARHPDA